MTQNGGVLVETFRALALFCEPPGEPLAAVAAVLGLPRAPRADEFTDLFVFQLQPYASVYAGPEGALGGEAAERVAGFWRALGADPPVEPDHLTVLLALYAQVLERTAPPAAARSPIDAAPAGPDWERVRAALLWEHILSWIGPFLEKVAQVGTEPYVAWSRALRHALWAEAARTPAPPHLPLHLREAPDPPGPAATTDDWIDALLTPVRCGIIVTRADLARAARDLGLGIRAGSRRLALRSLLEQAPVEAVSGLSAAAEGARAAHAADEAMLGATARFWADRAEATVRGLTGLTASQERR